MIKRFRLAAEFIGLFLLGAIVCNFTIRPIFDRDAGQYTSYVTYDQFGRYTGEEVLNSGDQVTEETEEPTDSSSMSLRFLCLPYESFDAQTKADNYTRLSVAMVILDWDNIYNIYTNAIIATYVNPEQYTITAIVYSQAPGEVCYIQGHSFLIDDWNGLFELNEINKKPI